MSGAGMGNGLAGLAYFASNDSDPYITLKKTVSTFEYIAESYSMLNWDKSFCGVWLLPLSPSLPAGSRGR